LSRAAEWYFERGEFSAASRTWQLLLTHPGAGSRKGEFLFRAAAAEALARNGDAARRLGERLEKEAPGAMGKVSGQEVKLREKLDELLAMPAWEPVDLARDEWPGFEGGPTRSRLLKVSASIGARLWAVAYADEQSAANAGANSRTNQLIQQRIRAGGGSIESAMLTSYPVLSNGTLFVHGGDRIMAISANAGTLQWTFPPQAGGVGSGATGGVSAINARLAAAGIAYRPSAHDSATVLGNQVFAVIPANAGMNVRDDVEMQMAAMGPSRVVCLNRENGHEIWSRASESIQLDNKGNLSFVGSPTVTRQGVFVLARKAADGAFTQQYLIRLDRETGEVTWSCYLCSTSSGAMYGMPYLYAGIIAVPTIVDDVVYICTGQGADCAVDANAGRILWLRLVDGEKTARSAREFYNPSIQLSSSWKFNPPLIAGDRMIVTDNPQSLRVYDRWNGKLLRLCKGTDLDDFKFEVVAGMIGKHLIVTGGERTLSLDINQLGDPQAELKPEWWVTVPDSDAGKLQGRPFLTADAYYVPYERKLVRIDPLNASFEGWSWPNTEKDTPGKPGNLLVTSEQVIVVNDTEVAGYSKWETARDNRLARIKQSPTDPEPYLALAEISFRTNHQDLAKENMKKAVDLANAGESRATPQNEGGLGEMLRRLYKTNLSFAENLLQKNDVPLRDEARFYYDEARASARDPEQQSEWRLRMAELSLKQKRKEEAATLYSEVLTDPALRSAQYQEGETLASAGATAEQRLRKLIAEDRELYRRFEDQAAGLLQKGRAQRDLGLLQQVMEGYPNSQAALAAATDLAAAYREKQDWENARRVLWWLQPRVQGEQQARVVAELVKASIGLKKFPSAAAWAARGERRFKEMEVATADGKTTFASLKAEVARALESAGIAGGIEGKLPVWHSSDPKLVAAAAPRMDGEVLKDNEILGRNLLVPVETGSQYRALDLLVTRDRGTLYVYESATGHKRFEKGIKLGAPISADEPLVLMGMVGDQAVLLQKDRAIGVNLRTGKIWSQPLRAEAGIAEMRRQLRIPARPQILANRLVVNNQVVQVDSDGNPVNPASADPEMVRQMAFATLKEPNFNTAKLINNRLFVVAGNTMSGFDIETGEPVWRDGAGAALRVKLPTATATTLVGNEDVLAVQVDAAPANGANAVNRSTAGAGQPGGGGSSSFYVVDAETGRFRKQINMESEHANWRAVGDDGTLYVVTGQAVAAYDLLGDQNKPLWRHAGIETKFAAATALTLDGVVVVDSTLNVMCLSLESGEMRWPAPMQLSLNSASGSTTTLRSVVDGDTVIFQSRESTIALYTTPSEEVGGQLAWVATPTVLPPLESLQLTDLYVVELAMGPTNVSGRQVNVVFLARKGGKLDMNMQVESDSRSHTGPMISAWQVLNGGIAFETGGGDPTTGGVVHFWRNLEAPGSGPAKEAQ
jgi:outer membrane protein assembly factor BamB/tetratricopeptide (TPR) repeat protein